ncbi:ParB N-terminal domain-containing protein [uncultured Parasutterella sp.]|uniref:ParB N-terminal domain-containing protein n=1 Tax=uncultured Parasutterella sp. TaxID=1263098 RepID=UPI002633B052|nr:ParB N-terminal domain-containing protein [uncultured Parasutterella sp.]
MASSMKDLFGFIAKDDSLRTEGQILRLSLGLIEVKPQVRKHFDEEELKALAESIKAVGLQEPLTVMEEDPHSHKYTLVNGERRYRALKLIYGDDFQNTMVECYVRAKPVEENHKKLLQIVDNEVRSGLTVSELVSTIRYLERNGIKRKEIAKALGGVTSAKMTKLYALADYDCPAFLEPLMSMTTSYQNLYLLRNLAKKYPDEVKNFCIECVEEGVFSETQMNALRAKIKEIESPDIKSKKSVDPDHTSDTNKEESSSSVKENEPTLSKEASEADSQEAKSVQNPWKASQTTPGEKTVVSEQGDSSDPEESEGFPEDGEESEGSSEINERDDYDHPSVNDEQEETADSQLPRGDGSSKLEKREQKPPQKLRGVRTILAFDQAANKLICILDDYSQVEVSPVQLKVKL